jgi:hypothetical protein
LWLVVLLVVGQDKMVAVVGQVDFVLVQVFLLFLELLTQLLLAQVVQPQRLVIPEEAEVTLHLALSLLMAVAAVVITMGSPALLVVQEAGVVEVHQPEAAVELGIHLLQLHNKEIAAV